MTIIIRRRIKCESMFNMTSVYLLFCTTGNHFAILTLYNGVIPFSLLSPFLTNSLGDALNCSSRSFSKLWSDCETTQTETSFCHLTGDSLNDIISSFIRLPENPLCYFLTFFLLLLHDAIKSVSLSKLGTKCFYSASCKRWRT